MTGELTPWEINAQPSGWIDTLYFTLPQTATTALTLENANGTVEFTRSGDSWSLADLASDESLNPSAVTAWLGQVSSIQMVEPIGTEAPAASGLEDPLARLTLQTENETYFLKVGRQDSADSSYVFSASNSPYFVRVAQFTGDNLVNNLLGLSRSKVTTQIEHYDHLAALFDAYKRIDNILIDLSRDIWQYISMGYFKQKLKEGEVGSSAMPHKVNPIDFENAEGNLGVANALLEHFAAKLPISRLQRDLTDSTVLRNVGVPLSHILISLNSLLKGLGKLELNLGAINEDLEDNWAVVAEGIQNILRREGYPKPYEALKSLTRTNEKITQTTISDFIDELDVTVEVKKELKAISPFNYTGR